MKRCPLCGEEDQIFLYPLDIIAKADELRWQCNHCDHITTKAKFEREYQRCIEPEFSGTDYWSKINFYRNNFDN